MIKGGKVLYIFSLILLALTLFSVKKTSRINVLSFDLVCSSQTKGLAILFVILGHLNLVYFRWDFMKLFGTIGVAIFLFSSGYGLVRSHQKKGLKNYGEKRLSAVYVPYFLITIVWLFIDYFTNQKHGIRINLLAIAGIDYTRSVDGTMWYIPFIFFWYGAFYCTFKYFHKDIYRIIILFGFSLISLLVWRSNLFGGASFQWLLHSLIFPLGVGYAMYGEVSVLQYKRKILVPLVIGAVVLFSLNYLILSEGTLFLIAADIISLAIIVPVFIMLNERGIKVVFLEKIGHYSYELYLVEGYLIDQILKSKFGENKYSLLIYTIVTVFSALILKKVVTSIQFKITNRESRDISLNVEA